VGGSAPPDLSFVEPILEQTEMLRVATGIVNIWSANAVEVAESYHRVEKAFPGRFLLGLGAGHREHTDEYQKPFEALVSYLDVLDDESVPASRRVLAALGPKVLDLAARRSAGAHPFLTTAAHTRVARESLDATVFLAPQQAVVLDTDAEKARAIGRPIIDFYLNLSNYRNNWKRLGFTDADLASPGSDRLIDALSPTEPPTTSPTGSAHIWWQAPTTLQSRYSTPISSSPRSPPWPNRWDYPNTPDVTRCAGLASQPPKEASMPMNPNAIGAKAEPQLIEWTDPDTLLYALGVGAGTADLSFTTENSHDIAQQGAGPPPRHADQLCPNRHPARCAPTA
jgi:probable F420-dependent oxidoreductase